jgi:hypothetical protein
MVERGVAKSDAHAAYSPGLRATAAQLKLTARPLLACAMILLCACQSQHESAPDLSTP